MIRRLIARWEHSGESRTVKWKHVRRSLLLGTFCLTVTIAGIFAWLTDNADDTEQAQYQTALIDFRRCADRAESGQQIDAVNKAAVAHAEESAAAFIATAQTFDEIVAVFERSGLTSERLAHIRALVDRYSATVTAPYKAGVDEYRAAANAYVPQDPDDCPPQPVPPD
jgi:hypothetical protein